MKRKVLVASIILMAALAIVQTNSFGQTSRPLTIKEAIDLSIKNSKKLKNSTAKIEEATAALREAVQNRLPAVGVSGSYLRLNNPNIDIKTKSTNSGGNTGGQSTGKPSSALYGMANVSLPIYAGLRIKYGIESSKYLQEAAKLDADNDREAVILNTIEAYENLYKSKAAVDLVKENLESNRQRVKDFTNLEKNGLLARNDLLKAELQESNTELSLLDAENNWKLANINMNLMLGLPDSTLLTVNEGDLQTTTNQLKGVEDYVQLGLQNRKDVSALSLRKKAANTGVKAAKGEMYPSIALTGGYVAADIPNVLTVTNAVNIGVGVKYNLNLGKNNSQVQQAKAREKQLEANQEMLADAIQLEINQAYQNYLLSQKKIDVYEKAIAQAEENYKIVKNKFDNALATTTDLLDADVAQLQARLNGAFSKADASVAYNKLLQTAGLLDNTQSK
ncbi:TolC family protein [Segetibacter koreensis]|uniref:TolC family protein n=1 Tax=Segetibacter koreensis TaxID=398037 RepID=UPI000361BC91|nr:TolC family protein [Segetibacter koreensis]